MNLMRLYFPKGFLWGAATSAHQVEGGNRNDWTEWEKENAPDLAQRARGDKKRFPEITDPSNYISGMADDHYNRYEEDHRIAASLNHNAHRFSIEWSRIEPEEGQFDKKEIDHYRKVIQSLKRSGMEPFITLWHWTLPLWVRDKGGVESREFPKYFARYARKMAEEYKNEVRFWMTLNEPTSVISNAYIKGDWPPQKKNPLKALSVAKILARAHREGYSVIKEVDREMQVGFGNIMTCFEPRESIIASILDYWNNRYFFNLCGVDNHDYLALQYYFHRRVGFLKKKSNEKISDMGWGLRPEAIYHLLKDLSRYDKPIYVTENGLADADDRYREWFITESLRAAGRAIEEGVDLKGYFHWSLIDNFEWDKGFWPRFGLVEVDRENLERRLRTSSRYYAQICKNNYID